MAAGTCARTPPAAATHPRQLMATASDSSKVVATLKKSDELVAMGPAAGGYLKVLGSMGEGFVKALLVAK